MIESEIEPMYVGIPPSSELIIMRVRPNGCDDVSHFDEHSWVLEFFGEDICKVEVAFDMMERDGVIQYRFLDSGFADDHMEEAYSSSRLEPAYTYVIIIKYFDWGKK